MAQEKASWEEYQMIRQAERAHQQGKEIPRWRNVRPGRGRPEDGIESAPLGQGER